MHTCIPSPARAEAKRKGDAKLEWWSDRMVDGLEQMTQTCALDVADGGPSSLEQIGMLLRLTRERVRQIEERALRRACGVVCDSSCRVCGGVGSVTPVIQQSSATRE